MVSIEKIVQKFNQLDEYLGLLRNISKTPIKDFLNDKIIIGSAKYYLQVSIECCLDVANHIIASERFRAPKDYADSFRVIEERGLIPSDLAQKLRKMAKFRNRLVHLYGEVDNAYVYEFMKEDLKDIEELRSHIINKYQIRSDQ
ncbi:MAG: DUF86 domain-containing protein [Deltaproteobacteria bacterium]|nr:DUF86 domain-containing protein [Deltaproteobacteria bacterium]